MFPTISRTEQTYFMSKLFTGRLLMIAVTASALCGCGGGADDGPKMGTVSGQVTAQFEPVTAGILRFNSDALGGASTNLNEDGTYSIEGGLPVGTYNVYLSGPEIYGLKDKQGNTIPVTIDKLEGVPQKYQASETSDLTADIKEGDNDVSFELNSD
jgi:hypothetical protein